MKNIEIINVLKDQQDADPFLWKNVGFIAKIKSEKYNTYVFMNKNNTFTYLFKYAIINKTKGDACLIQDQQDVTAVGQ